MAKIGRYAVQEEVLSGSRPESFDQKIFFTQVGCLPPQLSGEKEDSLDGSKTKVVVLLLR